MGTDHMKHALLTLGLAIASMALMTGTASAHGCHRDAEYGRGGLHFHAGPDCERIEGRREYRRERYEHHEHREYREDRRGPPQCVKKCQYIGPFKQCDLICR
jgi:hypothetical protein